MGQGKQKRPAIPEVPKLQGARHRGGCLVEASGQPVLLLGKFIRRGVFSFAVVAAEVLRFALGVNHLRSSVGRLSADWAFACVSLGGELGGMLFLAVTTAEKGLRAVDVHELVGLGGFSRYGAELRLTGLGAELVGLSVFSGAILTAEADKLRGLVD